MFCFQLRSGAKNYVSDGNSICQNSSRDSPKTETQFDNIFHQLTISSFSSASLNLPHLTTSLKRCRKKKWNRFLRKNVTSFGKKDFVESVSNRIPMKKVPAKVILACPCRPRAKGWKTISKTYNFEIIWLNRK